MSVVGLWVLLTFSTSVAMAQSTSENCSLPSVDNVEYKSSIVDVRNKRYADPGETLKVSVILKNEGNYPWFSDQSSCEGVHPTWLGTQRGQDRESVFFNPANDSGWFTSNRIHMKETRVEPGELATFEFELLAPVDNDFYREYFSPLVDSVTWMSESLIYVDFQVGGLPDTSDVIGQKKEFLYYSGGAGKFNLDGVRSLDVNISEQRMFAMIDGVIVKEILISSGAYETPTPYGTLVVDGKDKVRIGGKSPHYIMPYFLRLRKETGSFLGYGIHDLPSVGSSALRAKIRALLAKGEEVPESLYYGDALWTEAKTHIGRRVSHGCIRNDSAEFVFNFMNVGDKVYIHT